jgi:hypothetical protein
MDALLDTLDSLSVGIETTSDHVRPPKLVAARDVHEYAADPHLFIEGSYGILELLKLTRVVSPFREP